MRRNIYVTNCEENHIGEGIQGAKSTGPVLDDFDDSIESFGGGVRQPRFDKRDDVTAVFSKRIDKFSHGFKTSSESCCSPSLEESFGGPWRFEVPELLEFVLEKPSPVDTAVSFCERMEDARILFGASGRVSEKEPAQAFEYFAFLPACFSPLFLPDLIKGRIDGFDDMETIQDQGGFTAMLLNGPYVGFTHVTGGPENLVFLIAREAFLEEDVNRLPALALADPYDTGSIQVVDDGSVFMALAVGDLIHTDGCQSPDPMAIPQSGDALVEQIREGGLGDMKEPSGSLLSHELAVDEQGILKAIGDPSVGICPGDPFLDAAVGWTEDLLGAIAEEDTPSTYGHISPCSGCRALVDDSASTLTVRATATGFVGSHPKMQLSVSYFELVADHKDLFQTKQSYDKLSYKAHGFLPVQRKTDLKLGKEPMALPWPNATGFSEVP